MNCNCINDLEGKMANFMRDRAGDDATAKIQNIAFYMDGASKVGSAELSRFLQIMFRIKGSKKGYTGEKGKEMGCRVSHCPFCGRTSGRYEVGEDAGIAAAFNAAAAPICSVA